MSFKNDERNLDEFETGSIVPDLIIVNLFNLTKDVESMETIYTIRVYGENSVGPRIISRISFGK